MGKYQLCCLYCTYFVQITWALVATISSLSEAPIDIPINAADDIFCKEIGQLLQSPDSQLTIRNKTEIIYFDDSDKTWYHHTFTERVRENDATSNGWEIGLLGCLDMTSGLGGSIALTIEIMTTIAPSFKTYISMIVSATFGVSLLTSLRLSGSANCQIPAGHYGRLVLRPLIIDVPKGKRRKIHFNALNYPDSFEQWQDTALWKMFHSDLPIVQCVVTKDVLQCL